MLDTATMVAAIRSDTGASRRLLLMTRPDHLRASGLSAADVDALLDAVRRWRSRYASPFCGDPSPAIRTTTWCWRRR